MFYALLEVLFINFPVTTVSTTSGAFLGGILFDATGAIVGALSGLLVGIVGETRIQRLIKAATFPKWTGALLVGAIALTIGAIAIATK